jgi:hypothetical protein
MAVRHLLRGVATVVVADSVLWPITRTRYGFSTETQSIFPETVSLVEANLSLLVAEFLLISAVARAVISTVRYDGYVACLDRGMNPYRWYEYAVSASQMIVVIGMLAGVWDLGTLAALFGLVAVMNRCDLLMEQRNESTDDADWTPWWASSPASCRGSSSRLHSSAASWPAAATSPSSSSTSTSGFGSSSISSR